MDSYTLVLASCLISSGVLADRFGRRRVFQCGLAVFGTASLLCALAPSAGLLITARALQGIGASMLSPVALASVVNAMTDPKERAQAIGIWASVFGLSMAAGPVTAFSGAVVGAVAVFVALNMTLLLNTLYLQHTRQWTPLAAGLATLPLALGATVCAPWSGRMVGRTGPRLPLAPGRRLHRGRRPLPGRARPTYQRAPAADRLPAHRHRVRLRQRPDHQHRGQRTAARPPAPAWPGRSPPLRGNSVPPSASPSPAAWSRPPPPRGSPRRPARAGSWPPPAADCSSCWSSQHSRRDPSRAPPCDRRGSPPDAPRSVSPPRSEAGRQRTLRTAGRRASRGTGGNPPTRPDLGEVP
ncbi:MFS transporter [Streptomyces sp. NPDC003720]|uniref:MFS transporter n=1 Tax=Streptomyces sp. NPDC003720 TaxID=3364684 RepID=UPI0036B7A44E